MTANAAIRKQYMHMINDCMEHKCDMVEVVAFRNENFTEMRDDKLTYGELKQYIELYKEHVIPFIIGDVNTLTFDIVNMFPDFLFVDIMHNYGKVNEDFLLSYDKTGYFHINMLMFGSQNYVIDMMENLFADGVLAQVKCKPYHFIMDVCYNLIERKEEFPRVVEFLNKMDFINTNHATDDLVLLPNPEISDLDFINVVIYILANHVARKSDIVSSSCNRLQAYSIMSNNKTFMELIEKLRKLDLPKRSSINGKTDDLDLLPHMEDKVASSLTVPYIIYDNIINNAIKYMNFEISVETFLSDWKTLMSLHKPEFDDMIFMNCVAHINRVKTIDDVIRFLTNNKVNPVLNKTLHYVVPVIAQISAVLIKHTEKRNNGFSWTHHTFADPNIPFLIMLSEAGRELKTAKDYATSLGVVATNLECFVYMPEHQKYSLLHWNMVGKLKQSIADWCNSLLSFSLDVVSDDLSAEDMSFLPISSVPDTVFVAAMIAALKHKHDPYALKTIMGQLKANEVFMNTVDTLAENDLSRFGIDTLNLI